MSWQWNRDQESTIQAAVEHLKGKTSEQVFQISGKPGTGKTEVIHEIVRRVGIPITRVACMAYVGQAVSVMRTRGLWSAKTCHSSLYELVEVQMVDENGKPIIDEVFNKPKLKLTFVPKKLEDVDYIIVDEGGMIPEHMGAEIAKQGLPVIVCGDCNQLPPITGNPAYFKEGSKIHYLNQIMRQNANSGIVYLSERILNNQPIQCGFYNEVWVIEEKDLTDQMIMNSQIVLCGTNKKRDSLNNYIRRDLLKIYNTMPITGEKIICRKNNWNLELDGISLTNGLIGTALNDVQVDMYDGTCFYINFKPDLLHSYFPNIGCNYEYFKGNKAARDILRANPYLQGELFEPAYAITTHLSQGGEHSHGIYIQEYLNRDIQKNLDYTALTRFRNQAIFVLPTLKKYW